MIVNRKWVGERYLGARAAASSSAIAILLAFLAVSALPAHGQTIITVAGDGTYGLRGDAGPATSGSLAEPASVVVDSNGNLFFADSGHIWKVFGPNPPAGQTTGNITTVAGNGTYGFRGDGGPAIRASLALPIGVFVDSKGNVFIADEDNNRIREVFGPYPPAGQTAGNITTVAGNGKPGFSGDGGPATSASLNRPASVFVDSKGNLFIADTFHNRIREVFGPNPPAGQTAGNITTVAGNNGRGGFRGDGGPATRASLKHPASVFVDSKGNLFIADTDNNRIREVFGRNPPPGQTPGTIITVAGNGKPGFKGNRGPATRASLDTPASVFVDSKGNLFIADLGNNRIRKVFGPHPPAGRTAGSIITVAGDGTEGFSGDGGPATSASLRHPVGVFVDSKGNLFIADSENNRIREVVQRGESH